MKRLFITYRSELDSMLLREATILNQQILKKAEQLAQTDLFAGYSVTTDKIIGIIKQRGRWLIARL